MGDYQRPQAPATTTKRDRIKVMDEAWLWNHGPWYLSAFIIFVVVYIAIVRTLHGDAALSDAVGATGVLASVITLSVVIFQIDVGLRIARSQTEIADRELEILERQDAEIRRPPNLHLRFTDGQKDGTYNSIGTRLSYARAKMPYSMLFSIQNSGKSITGVSIEFWLPPEITIPEIPEQKYDWRQLPIYFNSAEPGPYFNGNRADIDTLRLAEGAPVDLAPIFFVINFAEVPPGTASSDFPPPLTIRYRLKAEGMTWPTDATYGELRLLATTTYDPANPENL